MSAELSPHNCVSSTNGKCLGQGIWGMLRDENSGLKHDAIDDSEITLDLKVPISIKFKEFLEHVISWDPNVSHYHVSIIFAIVTKFGPNVSHFEPWQWFVCLLVPGLHHEWEDPQCFAIDDEFGIDSCIVGKFSHVTRPKFGRTNSRTINYKLIVFFVVGCGCFKSLLRYIMLKILLEC